MHRHRLPSRSLLTALLSVVVVTAWATPALSVVWCHDWTVWAITKKDANKTSPGGLRTILQQKPYNYRHVLNYTAEVLGGGDVAGKLTPEQIKINFQQVEPKATPKLQPGDVIIIGEAHSGVVRNAAGEIDHFLQPANVPGTAISPEQAMKQANFHGGENWTLMRFFIVEREVGRVAEDENSPIKYQHPYLGETIQVWRSSDKDGAAGGAAGDVTYKYRVTPGSWTDTGINLKKGQEVALTAKGELTKGKDWKTGPDGYAHLGFRAWTFKLKHNKKIIDIGSSGSYYAQEDGPLLIGVTNTYEPSADDSKISGGFDATVTGHGFDVNEKVANSGGEKVAPPISDPAVDKNTGGSSGWAGSFQGKGAKEMIVGCPVKVAISDSNGGRAAMGADGKVANDIPGVTLEAKDDGKGGYEWYCALPPGDFVATFTGTGKGTVRVRTKQKDKPEMTYPPMEVEEGTGATLNLGDSPEAPPLRTGSTRELTPTAGKDAPGAGGESGTPTQVTAGKNLTIARWATFRRITDFPRGDGAHFVRHARMSLDGSRIVFGSDKGAFVMNTDGSDLRSIASGGPVGLVDISADGKRVAWLLQSDKPAIFTANSDGSDVTKMPANASISAMRMTADGGRLFVICAEKDGIYVMPTDGSDLRRIVDTASVCKLIKVDENRNHWRNLLDVSADGSRLVFHLLAGVFAVNGDGSGLHLIVNRKHYGINGANISADGGTVVVHDRGGGDPADSAVIFYDFSGRELSRFKKPSEDIWSAFAAADGGRLFTSPGLRSYSADGKTFSDPCDIGSQLWANPNLCGVSRNGSRACLVIDGRESTDQGRPNQFVIAEFNSPRAAGVPNLNDVSATPKFMLADGASNVNVSLKTGAEEPRSVGAVLVRNGARPANLNSYYGMNDNGQYGDATKADGTYTIDTLCGRTYDGKPLPVGPITLRVHVLDKDWNLTVVDLDGLEVRAP